MLIDLPETLAIQRWYLLFAMPSARLIGYQEYCNLGIQSALEQADVLLLPPPVIGELPAGIFDVAINIHSFAEITINHVEFYTYKIQIVLNKQGIFYCVNQIQKSTLGGHFEIESIPFNDY